MSVVPYENKTFDQMDRVKAASGRIQLRMKRTAEDIVEIGLDLQEIKENLPHGEFLPWIEAEFGMTDRAARKFIEVGKRYSGKSEIISDLSPTVIYELSSPSTPEPVREIIEGKAEKGETVLAKEVQELKRQVKEAERRAKDADKLRSENQTLKDSQELAKIKAKEEAENLLRQQYEVQLNSAAKERDASNLKIKQLEKDMQLVKKETTKLANNEAENLLKQKMSEKEDDLKKLRSKVKDAEAQMAKAQRLKLAVEKTTKELQDRANKIASVDWEAKSLLEDLDDLAGKLTQVLLTVQGLEHEHSDKTVKVAKQVAGMCENLALALNMAPAIET